MKGTSSGVGNACKFFRQSKKYPLGFAEDSPNYHQNIHL
jgi:hypothetical protein